MIFVRTKDGEDFSIWSEFEKWVEPRKESCIDFTVRIAESDNFDELRGFQNAADIVARSGGKFIMQIQIIGGMTNMIKILPGYTRPSAISAVYMRIRRINQFISAQTHLSSFKKKIPWLHWL